MKTIFTLILSLFITGLISGQGDAAPANDMSIGIQFGSASSWFTTNDKTIDGDGNVFGLKFGLIGEKYFQENYAIMGSISYISNQGGTLRHETGGNLLPKSNLSNPDWNTGQKPLPDGTKITYHLNYLDFALGLKLKTNAIGSERSMRIYAELPTLALGLGVGAKGDIEANGIDSEDENVSKDVKNLYISWGLGGGVELTLKSGVRLIGGVSFQKSFTDVTRDKGNKAFELLDDKGTSDPTDDQYTTRDEKSKALLNGFQIRVGMFF